MGVFSRVIMVVVAFAASTLGARPSAAEVAPAQKCEATKLISAGKKQKCLASQRAKEVLGKEANFARCDANFMDAFNKAEAKAGAGVCPTEGDAATVETLVDGCFDDLEAALSGSPNPPCAASPATGQTTCWDSGGLVVDCAGTGQDGDVQAGAPLSYTDNGDGTITDENTGLVWEKKSDDGSIHDLHNTYMWSEAFSVHVTALNAGGGFAGYTDWRVPNAKELYGIEHFEADDPSVAAAFNTGCVPGCTVLTCSCTANSNHQSSTTFSPNPNIVWHVWFNVPRVTAEGKGTPGFVRAVRGGL